MAPEESATPQDTNEPAAADAAGTQPAEHVDSQEATTEAMPAAEAAPIEAVQAMAEAPMDSVESADADSTLPTNPEPAVEEACFTQPTIPESPVIPPAAAGDASAAAAPDFNYTPPVEGAYVPPAGTPEQPYVQQQYAQQPYAQQQYTQQPQTQMAPAPKDRVVAGILGILLGALGIHKFYLGYTTEGVIALVISILGSCLFGLGPAVMAVIGIVEGCIYLFKTPEEFNYTYVYNKRGWF